VCGHATTSADTHVTIALPDRTETPAEVAATTHVIMDGIRDVENIGGIPVVIVKGKPVT